MVKFFIIIGSGIFVLLGVIHTIFTLQDLSRPRNFTPPEAALRVAMEQSAVALNPKINLWRAWLGFHFSHSLGLILFGGLFLYLGIFAPQVFASSPFVQSAAVAVPTIYLILSLAFWFSIPAIYSAVGLLCFLAAAGLSCLSKQN